jgi:hypothetical protein
MKEVFKCRERRMMRWDERWTKAQAWGFPCHPKKYPRSTSVKVWGCPRHPLLHQQKYQVIFQDTIFLLLHILCVILGASIVFLVSFALFAVINGLCGRETRSAFSCEYSYSSLIFVEYSYLAIAMLLAPIFHASLVQNLLVFFSYIWLALWSLFIIIFESCFK